MLHPCLPLGVRRRPPLMRLIAFLLALATAAPIAEAKPGKRGAEAQRALEEARASMGKLEHDRAREQLETSLRQPKVRRAPRSVRAQMYTLLGRARAELGDWKGTETAFKRALELDSSVRLGRNTSPKIVESFERAKGRVGDGGGAPRVTRTRTKKHSDRWTDATAVEGESEADAGTEEGAIAAASAPPPAAPAAAANWPPKDAGQAPAPGNDFIRPGSRSGAAVAAASEAAAPTGPTATAPAGDAKGPTDSKPSRMIVVPSANHDEVLEAKRKEEAAAERAAEEKEAAVAAAAAAAAQPAPNAPGETASAETSANATSPTPAANGVAPPSTLGPQPSTTPAAKPLWPAPERNATLDERGFRAVVQPPRPPPPALPPSPLAAIVASSELYDLAPRDTSPRASARPSFPSTSSQTTAVRPAPAPFFGTTELLITIGGGVLLVAGITVLAVVLGSTPNSCESRAGYGCVEIEVGPR